ncbi:MAG: hypothetical protein ACLS4Z_10225 [Christensenellaceae bacterium]
MKKIKGKLRGVNPAACSVRARNSASTTISMPGRKSMGCSCWTKALVGEDIRKIVGLDDWIFDISVTANRPDCQCIFGMAREVAAALKKAAEGADCSIRA